MKIECLCGKYHNISDVDLYQTHFYVKPYSCMSGDYWKPSESKWCCPDLKILNRILWNDYELPWGYRDMYDFSIQWHFANKLANSFKSMTRTYEHEPFPTGQFKQSFYYIDKNRKEFKLPTNDDFLMGISDYKVSQVTTRLLVD